MVLRQHVTDDDVVTTEASSIREPFGIAQAVCVALGVFFVVIGAVGLARTGLDEITAPVTEVAGLEMTPLLATIHLALGIIALFGAASRGAGRAISMFIGPTMIALGVIALIEQVDSLGWDQTNGIVYLIVGVIALAAAIATPAAVIAQRRHDAHATSHVV